MARADSRIEPSAQKREPVMSSKAEHHVVLTTTGTDNICSAAMVLLAYPEADIQVTSMSKVTSALTQLAEDLKRGATLHVCGVGIEDRLDLVCEVLRHLRESGVHVVWYCGRGYLKEDEPELSKCCEVRFDDCGSNTECVLEALNLEKDSRAELLLRLAQNYLLRQKSEVWEDSRWWDNYISAVTAQHILYGKDTLRPCIRKLAGLLEVTEEDNGVVKSWDAEYAKFIPYGSSPAMVTIRERVLSMAPHKEPVLIYGPSGSGKEVLANLLHNESPRRKKPFIAVNCAIFSGSSDLANDRLFGHESGAFTGASSTSKGAFELADGGTLFLDEIAELPPEVQTQLLRVLEEGTICPIGTMKPKHVDVRIVAASNKKLVDMVNQGTFRHDLYYRLSVLHLDVPPLHERRHDIKSIARVIVHRLQSEGHDIQMSREDREVLMGYDWPGNVRQLQNVLKRAALMKISIVDSLKEEIRRTDGILVPDGGNPQPDEETSRSQNTTQPEDRHDAAKPGISKDNGLRDNCLLWPMDVDSIRPDAEVRQAYMKRALELCDGSWTRAAQKLGLATNTIRKWLEA